MLAATVRSVHTPSNTPISPLTVPANTCPPFSGRMPSSHKRAGSGAGGRRRARPSMATGVMRGKMGGMSAMQSELAMRLAKRNQS